MPEMPLPLSGVMQRAAVHGVVQALAGQGLRPGELTTEWYDRDRDGGLSEREIRDAFGRDRMVLSLRQDPGLPAVFPHPEAPAERAAGWMDAADGRQDGWVDFPSPSPDQPQPSWPDRRLPTHEVARQLASGDWVIGTRLMHRRDARHQGLTVTEIQSGSTAWPQPSREPVLVRALD